MKRLARFTCHIQFAIQRCLIYSEFGGSTRAVREQKLIPFGFAIRPPYRKPDSGHLSKTAPGPELSQMEGNFPSSSSKLTALGFHVLRHS